MEDDQQGELEVGDPRAGDLVGEALRVRPAAQGEHQGPQAGCQLAAEVQHTRHVHPGPGRDRVETT